MPGFYNEVWQAVEDEQYEEVMRLIENEEALVNSVDQDGTSLLSRMVNERPKSMSLLQAMGKQPGFNLYYHSPDSPTSTNLKTILLSGLQVFTFFEKHSDIVWDGKTLSYGLAKKSLGNATSSYEREFKKNPESDRTKREAQRVSELQTIVSKLRDLTMLQAMETDNPKLVALLEKAGAKAAEALSNGDLPIKLLQDAKNPKLIAWFQAQEAKAAAIVDVVVNSSTAAALMKLKQEAPEKKSPSVSPGTTPKGPAAADRLKEKSKNRKEKTPEPDVFAQYAAKQKEHNALYAERSNARADVYHQKHKTRLLFLEEIIHDENLGSKVEKTADALHNNLSF